MKLEIIFAEIIINNFYDMFWNIEKVQMAKLFPYPMAIFCHLINFSQSTRKCKIENFVQKHQHGRATKYYYFIMSPPYKPSNQPPTVPNGRPPYKTSICSYVLTLSIS
jgi:hypothetical protein